METAVKHQAPTTQGFVLKVSVVAALGGLLFGYDTAVIAGAIGFLQTKFNLSPAMVGWAASSAIWGCAFGAMFAGYFSDRFGRKKVLLVTAVLFFISSLGASIPTDLTQFVIARFIGGLGIGAASMLSPLYISEIAPAKSRGTLVSLYQLAIVIGINLIYFVNLKIASLGDAAWNVDLGWRYMLGSGVIPAFLFLVLLFLVPESPRWLVKKNRDAEALDTLEKVNGREQALEVMAEIKAALSSETGTVKELFGRGLRMALIVGVVLSLFSQITGINAIIYYAPEIFKSIGFAAESAFFQTVLIGVINTLFTFIAIWLIDRAGRRTLLLWGVTGMIICLLGTGICFYFNITQGPWLLIFILGYIASFASSLGPIPWVIMSEIFPTKTRGIAMSFCTIILWIGVLFITQFTPMLLESIGGAFTFWLFMVNSIILLVFTWMKIPETKQRTLEEIERSWKH
ncbi:sugar porter family MFS transporter [Fulvivirgaceae bacterium PWU4]|uniref:Sugar porter family MFS transporter n=1 Tax=Chryseosolibacter histidini TaxID=2782349 RepID=A0AAP2DLP7_9BACT|nr:sugar porter family MFS transporter [Chryseosolibacter histidini]MBT1697588.1 sugar porter family MFS transporter [Chryseosolibacter histidini]